MMMGKKARMAYALVLVIITVVVLSRVERCAAAGGTDFDSAKRISKFGNRITDRMDGSGNCRFYKVKLSRTSVLKLQVSSSLKENLYVKIYNGYYNELTRGEISRNINGGKTQNTFSYYLEAGDYYIEFSMIVVGEKGGFSFVPTMSTLSTDDKESNNDVSVAQKMSFNRNMTGLLTVSDRTDIYAINMKKDGQLAINISSKVKGDINVEIIAPDIQDGENHRINGGSYTYKKRVKKGIYYVKLDALEDGDSGKYTIWATSDIPIDSLNVSPRSKTLSVGKSFQLQTIKKPGNTTEGVIYYSSNSKVASVNSSGKVVGRQKGTATISIRSKWSGLSTSCKVKVQEVQVTSLELNIKDETMKVGDSIVLLGIPLPNYATNKKILWSSDKPEVAMVNKEGRVTAVAPGVCTITGTVEKGTVKAKCTITVKEALKGEEMQDEKDEPLEEMNMERSCLVKVGEERVMVVTAAIDGKEMKEVEWSSSNNQVLKVDKEGKIIGISQGVAVIVAQVEGGKKTYCTVLVRR